MGHAKTDWCNPLNRRKLDALLQIDEEGPQIAKPDINESTYQWFNDWVHRLSSKNHNKQEKRLHLNNSSAVDIVMQALTDLDEEKSQGFKKLS